MNTWKLFEGILDKALVDSGYKIEDNKNYSFICSLTGRKHMPDKVIKNPKTKKLIIISKKWQEVNGTADEKIMYEVLKLLDLKTNYSQIENVYILLGGKGFDSKLGYYYLSQNWNSFLDKKYKNQIKIINLNSLLPLISKKAL